MPYLYTESYFIKNLKPINNLIFTPMESSSAFFIHKDSKAKNFLILRETAYEMTKFDPSKGVLLFYPLCIHSIQKSIQRFINL